MTGRHSHRRVVASAAAAATVLCAVAATTGAAAAGGSAPSARGDIGLFARIGPPGEPSFSLVTPQHRVFVGTFESVTATDTAPSKVFEFNAHGGLRRTFTLRGQAPGKAHGVQVAEQDRDGRLYLLDQDPARIVVLNPRSGSQRTYATFADVPTCSAAHRATGCSNTILDNAPEPDYAAWLPDGSLLVTDYAQQLIWRVPPHGGAARVWFNDKVLDGEQFGPAGIVLAPNHRSLLLTVSTGGLTTLNPAGLLTDNPARGRLYRVDLTTHDRVRRLLELWSSDAGQAPDGFAISRHHHVYVALSGPTGNTLVELARRQGRWRRVWQVPKLLDGAGSSPVLWDTPTSAQFLGDRLLVTNQAYFTGIASHWAVLSVETGESGLPPYIPPGAGLPSRGR